MSRMIYQVEEKNLFHWVPKVLIVEENEIRLYKNDDKNSYYNDKSFESILFDKMECANLEGNTFNINDQKNVRTFRLSSKDLKDVIFTKILMKQDNYFLKSVLSKKYLLTKGGVEKEKTSKIERITKQFMSLFPILFQDITIQLEEYKRLISGKKRNKERFVTLYHSLRGLIYELKSNNDSIYSNLMAIIKEYDIKPPLVRSSTIEAIPIKRELNLIQVEEDRNSMRSDSFSISFFNEEHKFKPGPVSSNENSMIQELQQQSQAQFCFASQYTSRIQSKEVETPRPLVQEDKTNRLTEKKVWFVNSNYNFIPRKKLQHHIKFSPNFITEYLNGLSKKQESLPITLNEPITMLQKQCEKMINSPYLTKADMSNSKEMKLSNIAAFIFGELSLGFNRFMEPITPLQGETYEYYDNYLQYRFFAEEVSSHPPISAYIGESNNFIINGNTKHSLSINIANSSFETNYLNPVTIKLLKSNEIYKYNLPTRTLKYRSLVDLSIEYNGSIEIADKITQNDFALIQITNNCIDGKIYVNNKITNLITGSLENTVKLKDIKTNEISLLWKQIKDEKYLLNQVGRSHYYIPSISYNLNNTDQKLLNNLPKTDTRQRIELREYEKGNIIVAQQETTVSNRNCTQEYISNNYQPKHFSLKNDDTYVYKENYWQS